jgi:hypothetical protein
LWVGQSQPILSTQAVKAAHMNKQLIGYSIVLAVGWVSVVLLVMYWMSQ